MLLKSPPSKEQFKIDPFLHIAEEVSSKASKKSAAKNEEELEEKEAAVN